MNCPRLRGFTLIEMLVVMVLLGLLSSLALPAMNRWYDAMQIRSESAVLVQRLRLAAFTAGAERRDLAMTSASFTLAGQVATLTTADAASPPGSTGKTKLLHLELPPAWQLRRVVDAKFLANGLCEPGLAAFERNTGQRVEIVVNGPLCSVEMAPLRAGTAG